ncbi:diguanylate cyclase [Clostridiales bacterium COT073_COT-073]|nr:diguanylate cyclase [Clostridiales bacterium COT073_COT-073]
MQNLGKEFQKKYRLLSVLDEKETYSLYEVEEINTGNHYIVKYYRLNLFWQAIGSLKQQLEVLAADQSEFLPNIYDIGEENSELYVVTEKIEGYNLSELIGRQEKFDVIWVLRLVKKILEGIQYFVKHGIAMYLVNPKNIFIIIKENPEEIEVKFSELVSGGYVEEKDSDFMMNQAIYMAPEQVGITRKKFDVRSDLYSLGVIIYQLLAGRLPFRAKTLNQYMYQQIAQIPGPISRHNSEVNSSLDEMVLCLLEKDPNNRYQSTESLLYDIREYLSGNVNFECNAYDVISKIHFREKDFLPNREMNQLESLVGKGKGLVVVSGAKNTGKSVALDIVKLEVKNPKNILLYADCLHQEFRADALWRLLYEYLKIFEQYPLRRQDILRQEVAKAGISQKIICADDSRFGVFFEKANEGHLNSPVDEVENLLKLWQVIGQAEEHLVVILENLMLDQAGTDLILRFYRNIEKMLLCISCREHFPEEIKADLSIALHKLTEKDILVTLEWVTGRRLEDAGDLAHYVYQRSRGNIYLTTEVANWLFQKEALSYREGRWRINPLVLFELGLPAEVAKEIINRRGELSEDAMRLVMILAAIEGQLPWTYVKRVADQENINTDEVLNELTKAQFVEQKIKDTLYYTFSDKEIYNYFRQQLSKDQIKYFCEKVAEVLESEYRRFRKEEEAIAMTHYYLQAQNNEKIKEYAFDAALFLKNQGKNQQAIEVLKGFLNALEYQDDEIHLFYNAQKMAGEIYIAEGKPQEAEKTFEELLQLDLTSEMRADILEERSWVAFYKGNFQEAFDFVRMLMKEKKTYLPESDFGLYCGIAWQTLVRLTQKLLGESKNAAVIKSNRNIREKINQNIWWVSLMVDVRYFAYLVLRTTNQYWSKYKKSQELAIAYFGLGQALMGTPFRRMANNYLDSAVKITEEIGDDHVTMLSYTILAYRSEIMGDYEAQLNYALMALQIHKKLQFSPFYGMTMNALIHAYNYLGDFNNMLRYNDFYQKRAMETGDNYGIISSYIYYLQYYRGQAKFVNAIESGEKALALSEQNDDYFDQFCSCAELGITYFFARNEEQATYYLEKALKIKEGRFFPVHYTMLVYSYYAMILCYKQKQIRKNFPEDKSLFPAIQKAIRTALREKKYPTYYGSALRAMAEWQVLLGNVNKAKKYFIKSIDHCICYKREWLAAVTQMVYGDFLAGIGETTAAMQQFVLAEYHFRNLKVEAYALIARRELENLQAGFGGMENDFDKFQRRLQAERKNLVFTDLIRDLSSVLDYRELIQKMIMVLLEASGAQQIVVLLPDEHDKQLRVEEFYTNENLKIKNKEEMIREIPMNLIRSVQQTKEILALDNAEKTEYAKMDEKLTEKHIKSLLILPICYKNTLKAVCYLENSLSSGIFTKDIVENMKIVASQMAVSMENAMLYKIATTDDLTGLYTRKHFDYLFQEELQNARETSGSLGVVFIDIDKFKNINDTYGHIIGDKVLTELSAFLRGNCRVTDVIGRFGGEEIILLLRGTPATESYKFAERLRQKLEQFPIDIGDGEINITASFGISSYPEHGETRVELINKADTALYRSKNEGRNRVTLAK